MCCPFTVDDVRQIISIAHGTLQYPSAPELQQIRDAYLNTITNASQKYQEKRRESLLAISAVLSSAQQAVLTHHEAQVTKAAAAACVVYTQKLTRVREGPNPSHQLVTVARKAANEALAAWQAALVTDLAASMKGLDFPQQLPDISKHCEAWKNTVNTLMSPCDEVITGYLDITSTTAVALHDIVCGKGSEGVLGDSQEFTEFRPLLQASLLGQVGRALDTKLVAASLQPAVAHIMDAMKEDNISLLFDASTFWVLESLSDADCHVVSAASLRYATDYASFRLHTVRVVGLEMPLCLA